MAGGGGGAVDLSAVQKSGKGSNECDAKPV